MTDFRGISLLLILTSLICCCVCEESMASVVQRLGQFDRKLRDNKKGIIAMEENVLNLIEVSKSSMKAELKENIREQVRIAMVEILQGDDFQRMVPSEIVAEVRLLRRDHHQLKRQMLHFSKSLGGLQNKMSVLPLPSDKKAYVCNRGDSFDACVRNTQRLKNELYKCKVTADNLKTDNDQLLAVNQTRQSEKSQLNTNFSASVSPGSVQDVNTTSRPSVSTSVKTPSLPVLTSVSTVRPEVDIRRILIVPLFSPNNQQFRQLNIHSKSLSVYQHLSMKRVVSVTYIANMQKLLIGLYNPVKILSSNLDTGYSTVVRKGVRTFGMAVDEDRDIVFMTTERPPRTISRMSTQGKDFTRIIDLFNNWSSPFGITLDKKRKKIYACNVEKMFTVTYDGQGLETLATGTRMFAVTWDPTAGVLYYNNDTTLMKMTVFSNVSTEVTTLDVIPWSMTLYRGTIYYGSYSNGQVNSGSVGAVNVTRNTVAYILKSVPMDKISGLHIQLIP